MLYLDAKDCKQLFSGREVYVFGAGVDGEKLYSKLADTVTIGAFIDNKRCGDGNYFCGKEIISLDQFRLRRTSQQPVLVAAYRFAVEMADQLVEEGFVPEKDFFIWDDMYIYHPDDVIKRFIEFRRNIWKDKMKEKTDKIILVPFDNRHDLNSVYYAYLSNYLAEKHNAAIYGYFRCGAPVENASKALLEVYKAFNMVDLIDTVLDESMQKESDEILKKTWSGLYTWEDWKRITIYDICLGTTVIRDILREIVPDYDLRSERMYHFLKNRIETIVFWYHYIREHKIKAVLLSDGVCWEGYIRDIAVTGGIPVYIVEENFQRAYFDFHYRTDAYLHYKEMWKQLSSREQQYGIQWAKEHIDKRLRGSMEELECYSANKSVFSMENRQERVLDDDNKIKILICPHIFEEDPYWCGEQIFDNSYMEWLCHLGELSERTSNYHWYLKVHPHARRRDRIIMDHYIKRYPQIKMLPKDISPIQLKQEGAGFALTVCGTLGHEYPALGIQVINAGINPHSAYDFTWNPTSKEEYDDLIMNLDKLEPKGNLEELYQFYSMHYLFYDREYIPYREIFYENPYLPMVREELEVYGKELGTWKYEEYMKEWSPQKHEKIVNQMEEIFRKMDEWRPDVFYRRKDSYICDDES